MARLWGAWLLVLLVLAPSALGWTQTNGDAGRSGAVRIAGGPLDVIANWSLGDVRLPTAYSAQALWTDAGLWVSAFDDGCEFLLVRDVRSGVAESAEAECDFERLEAYHRAAGVVVTCTGAPPEAPFIRGRRADTMEVVWEITGASLGLVSDVPNSFNSCQGASIAPNGIAYVPTFIGGLSTSDAISTELVSIDVRDGHVEWIAPVVRSPPAAAPAQGGLVGITLQQGPGILPHGVTVTSTGLVLTGRVLCTSCTSVFTVGGPQSVVAWFDLQGQQLGYVEAMTGDASPGAAIGRTRAASRVAVASGGLAALVVSNEVLVINPETMPIARRAPLVSVEPPEEWISWPVTTWTGSRILAGLMHSISAYDAETLVHQWSWSDGVRWTFSDRAVLPTGEVLVLVGDATTGDARLVRLDAESGEVRGRTPLSLIAERLPENDQSWYSQLAATPDAMIVTDAMGAVNVLGRADPSKLPRAGFTTTYPGIGEELPVTLPSEASVQRYLVDWGDGASEEADAGAALTHVYAVAGAREVRVTALHADGTTATSSTTVQVGGTPPPQLTTLQRAFSPENQNWTFFFLGLAVTVLGVVFTVGRQRRRFNKLERELAAVEEIRMMSVEDPRAAVVALKAYRDRLPHDLARGKIDDSQYQVLDIRSARLLKVLRTRMFAPFDSRLSPRFHRLLDAAFEDAILQPSERNALVRALEDETELRGPERAEIVAILDDFTSGRPDAPTGRVAA